MELKYLVNGTSGAGTFESNGGGYVFGTLCLYTCLPTAVVTGTYVASPVLA